MQNFIFIIVACLGLFVTAANASGTEPVNKPVIAYVTDTVAGAVEFTDGEFTCWPGDDTFVLTVKDSTLQYNSIKGAAYLLALVELHNEDSLTETFTMKLSCRPGKNRQDYYAIDSVKTSKIIEWLTKRNGFVQLTIPGLDDRSWVTVLIPCNEHWLGY